MFLQYGAPGALIPLFTLRLEELDFTPVEMGWTCATQALGALLGPLLAGQVADRWLPAQRCLTFCALVSAALLWILADLTAPAAVFWTSLVFWTFMAPALSLATSVSFTHLEVPQRDFGRVRMWGTVGWVMPGLVLGYWFSNPDWFQNCLVGVGLEPRKSELADAIRLAGILAFLLGLYAFTLPDTPPQRHARSWLAPLAALGLMRERSFAVFIICMLGICVTLTFPTQALPLLLEHLGIERSWLSATLTISQSMEIVCLFLLPMLLLRFGRRGTMLVGLGAWVVYLGVLTAGQPTWLVIASLSLNGLCICCFLVSGQVFVNSRAQGDIRASAQALFSFVAGVGMLGGNLLVGWVRRQVNEEFPPTFTVAAVIASMLAMIFLVGFSETEPAMSEPVGTKDTIRTPVTR